MRNMNRIVVAGTLLGASFLAGCGEGPSSDTEIDTCNEGGPLSATDVIVDIEREDFGSFGQQMRGAAKLVEDRGADISVVNSEDDGFFGSSTSSDFQTADVLCSLEGDIHLSHDGEILVGQLATGEVIFAPRPSESGEYFSDQRGDVTDFAELDPTSSESEE